VVSAHDSVNGNWTYQYDDLNRIASATASSGPFSGTTMSWTYDRYGNRWTQAQTGVATQSLSYTGHNNRIDATPTTPPVTCLSPTETSTSTTMRTGLSACRCTRAERQPTATTPRASASAKQSVPLSTNMSTTPPAPDRRHAAKWSHEAASRSTPESGTWRRTTCQQQYLFYPRRLARHGAGTGNFGGVSYETCSNLPFGDGQQCTGAADISPMHFTGKPRDTETNLDYFGARYFNSGMARWMSPDWAPSRRPCVCSVWRPAEPEPIRLRDQQSVSRQDGDGHLMNIYQLYTSHSSVANQMSMMMSIAW